jgi:GATA-binding protein
MNYMMYPDMDGTQFQSQSGIAFATPTGADGRVMADLNGEHPPTQETLLAENASLKTRVSELEVIQELYRGRLQQLEQDEANARQTHELSKQTEAQLHSQLEGATQTETQLRNELEESHRRENMLKRRLDEMELELKQAKESSENLENGRSHKKPRVDDVVEDLKSENADTPQSAS